MSRRHTDWPVPNPRGPSDPNPDFCYQAATTPARSTVIHARLDLPLRLVIIDTWLILGVLRGSFWAGSRWFESTTPHQSLRGCSRDCPLSEPESSGFCPGSPDSPLVIGTTVRVVRWPETDSARVACCRSASLTMLYRSSARPRVVESVAGETPQRWEPRLKPRRPWFRAAPAPECRSQERPPLPKSWHPVLLARHTVCHWGGFRCQDRSDRWQPGIDVQEWRIEAARAPAAPTCGPRLASV